MRISTLICILFIANLSVSGNEPAGLNGIVVKPDGTPMESAFVVIHDYQEPNRGYVSDTWQSRTAGDGTFSFAAVSGCYDVFVSTNARYLPFSQRLCFQPNHSQVRIKIKLDPHPSLLQR